MSDPQFSFDDLVSPITDLEFRESIYSLIAQQGIVTTSWQRWAPTRVIIWVVSKVLAAFSLLVVDIAAAQFLGTVQKRAWAVLLAKHRFGVDNIPEANFASCSVRLVNTGAGIYNVTPGTWVFRNPLTGATFVNLSAFSLGIGATLNDVPIVCTRKGSVGTSLVGTIVEIVTTTLGGVTVTNTTSATGIDDATIDEIVALAVARRDSRSANGPRGGYEYAARIATRPDGSSIGVSRVRCYAPGDSTVSVYVATATGEVSGDASDEDSDLGRVALSVYEHAEVQSVAVSVIAATAEAFDVLYEVWCFSNIAVVSTPGPSETDRIKTLIAAALAKYVAAVPIGGFTAESERQVYADALNTVIDRAHESIYRVKVIAPVGAFAVSPGAFPRLGVVAGTVNFRKRDVG